MATGFMKILLKCEIFQENSKIFLDMPSFFGKIGVNERHNTHITQT
jgi:hypothetical protein